jgi:hypothetical protein
VALTAGFAGVTFVRLVGLVVLGPAPASADGGFTRPGTPGTRDRAAADVPASPAGGEYRWPGRIGLAVLAACPLAFAAVTPLEIRVIAAGLTPAIPASLTLGALKSPWVLQPVFAGFSILSPSWLWIAMPAMLALVLLLTVALPGRRALHVRRVPAWRSATIGVDGESSYTAFGYANPTRRVLASVLHTQVEVADVHPDDAVPHLSYESDVVEVVENWLYRPTARAFNAVVATAKRLQSGRLDAYLLYMLIALVATVAVVTALS